MNDGGPAFPVKLKIYVGTKSPVNIGYGQAVDGEDVFEDVQYPGMSLRDYFAAKAMQGELSAQGRNRPSWDYDYEALAIRCYDIAGEMLKVREK